MKKTTAIILMLLVVTNITLAQTFHFVSIFDTNDEKIGKGMDMERKMITNEMQTIGGFLMEFGYDYESNVLYGADCGKAKLMDALANLHIEPEDIVLFYYGGHGGRSFFEQKDRFPQMCLGELREANYVPASLVKNIITKKKPRFTIVLTGCCNSEGNISVKTVVAQAQSYTTTASIDKNAYKKMFLENEGVVQMTSSIPKEFSFCGDNGSLFAHHLLKAFEDVGKGKIMPSWEAVCAQVKAEIAMQDIICDEKLYKQHPYYEINVNGNQDGKPHDDDKGRRIVNNSTLAADLNMLLDKSQNASSRLQLVPQILSKHFSPTAKVLTLGRDMQTLVDYEDANIFLRRIAMSPYIDQINVVDQQGEVNTQITVHEVRNR